MQEPSLGLSHFWASGDVLTHTVAYILLAMSVLSWYYILSKAWVALRLRRTIVAGLNAFWSARTLDDAVVALQRIDTEKVFAPLADKARQAMSMQVETSLAASVDRTEFVTRTLRQEITRSSSRLEGGLTLLASVGSTAPFVGLFGTVWGIYHALLAIAQAGQVQMDKVAGPVGEALVMTAAGLAVAIPAVLAYNAFNRINRITLSELDGFAHDVFALVTTGSRVPQTADRDALRAQNVMPIKATVGN